MVQSTIDTKVSEQIQPVEEEKPTVETNAAFGSSTREDFEISQAPEYRREFDYLQGELRSLDREVTRGNLITRQEQIGKEFEDVIDKFSNIVERDSDKWSSQERTAASELLNDIKQTHKLIEGADGSTEVTGQVIDKIDALEKSIVETRTLFASPNDN